MQKQTGGSGGLRCAVAALLGLLGLGAVVLIGGAAWALTHLEKPADALPAALNPARVAIIQPVNGESLMLDETLRVYAKAFGEQPIQDVQLYVDGKLLSGNGADFPAGALKATVSWAWTPKEAGEHVLTARVRTVDGKGNVSNAVVVKALAADQFPSFTSLAGIGEAIPTPDPGDQEALAGGAPVPPPAGSDGGGAPGDEPAEEPAIPPPGQEPEDQFLPISIAWWIQQKFGKLMPLSMPEVPQINGLAKDCDGQLIVKDNADNETGFFLYRLDPKKFNFERVATLDGKQGKQVFSYVDKSLASGTYFYYVAAFNPKGEAPSNVVSVKIEAPACAAAVQPIFEPDSIPVDPAQPVDKMYCYGSADDMPWVRLPTGQGVFLAPVNGKFDLAPYWDLIPLPKPLPPKFLLNMECWGWNGETLIYLGASSKEYVTEKEQKKQKPGEPGDGKGGGPKIAPPYNLILSSDINQCTEHAKGLPQYMLDQCKEAIGFGKSVTDPNSGNSLLFWDWNQYDGCAPGDQVCESSYSAADSFKVYRIRNGGKAEMIQSMNIPMTFWYLTGNLEPISGDIFYVTAADSNFESDDSNHVVIGASQKIILGPSGNGGLANDTHLRKNKFGNGWVQTPPVSDEWFSGLMDEGYIMGGYSRLPGADSLLWTSDWYGRIRFDLPQNVIIHSAKIYWTWKDGYAVGPGTQDYKKGCKTYLGTKSIGGEKIIASNTWADKTNYDVTGMVETAKMLNQKQVEMWFTHKPGFSSGDIPYSCYLKMNGIKLILEVSDVK